MGKNVKCNFNACGLLEIVMSILFSVAIGILFAIGLIPNIVISVWIAFGLGVLTLIFLIIGVFLAAVTPPNSLSKCLCKNNACLLAGIVGTILSALATLSIQLSIVIPVIILITIGAFFFSFMIIALTTLILCVICRICSRRSGPC